MNDDELGEVWTTLTPTGRRRPRVDARVFAWLEARDTPLAAEWLGLFRIEPFAALGLATLSAIAILVATPFGWVLGALM